MSYLLGAYGFAILVLGGYVVYVARQARAVAARLRELESEPQAERIPSSGDSAMQH